jgi:hypothetical protein
VKVSTVELESFEDMILMLHSRMTPVSMVSALMCTTKICFTIISAGDEQIFVFSSPPPQTKCRFAYVDENGKVKCSENPPPGKPVVFIIAVKNVYETDSLTKALQIG